MKNSNEILQIMKIKRGKVFKSGLSKFLKLKGCLPQYLRSPLLNTLPKIKKY